MAVPTMLYRGALGRRLVAAATAAGSPLSVEDLAAHRSEWMEPLTIPWGGGVAASFPPPTQGMSALALLGLAEGFDLAALDEADYVHVMVEAIKLAFADRDRHLTDPATMSVTPAALLAPERLARLRARISRTRAMAPAEAAAPGGGDTIAIVTADAAGNAVSLIQSLYYTFGAGLVAGDTGIVLQNRGAFFSLDPRHVNALAPRKHTMHTLIPSMYLAGRPPAHGLRHHGRARASRRRRPRSSRAGSSAGWARRPAWRRRAGSTGAPGAWPPGRSAWRAAIRRRLARDLAARGHDVRRGEDWDDLFGHAHAIWIEENGGGLGGGSDPRADGAALGY